MNKEKLHSKPKILETKVVAESKIFFIEELKLQFSNGNIVNYERTRSKHSKAVIMIPVNENKEVIMIKEYAVAIDNYHLSLPKGKIDDKDKDFFISANRELSEEIKLKANNLSFLGNLYNTPNYNSGYIKMVLCESLSENYQVGDEPEELETIIYPLDTLEEWVDQIIESKTISALFLARNFINNRNKILNNFK